MKLRNFISILFNEENLKKIYVAYLKILLKINPYLGKNVCFLL